MEPARILYYFDYVDPGSYVTEIQLMRLLPSEVDVMRLPFELCPPPKDYMDSRSVEWKAYERSVIEIADEVEVELSLPDFLPWTRKAHELRLHAAERALEDPLHDALFRARFEDRADIGRVDVLVDLAVGLGLDFAETKAVLDVDRHAARVVSLRREAKARGVRRTPTLRIGSKSLEGPRPIDDLRGFLESARVT